MRHWKFHSLHDISNNARQQESNCVVSKPGYETSQAQVCRQPYPSGGGPGS